MNAFATISHHPSSFCISNPGKTVVNTAPPLLLEYVVSIDTASNASLDFGHPNRYCSRAHQISAFNRKASLTGSLSFLAHAMDSC